MKNLKRDVLRLALLGALWIAHGFLPTPTAAEGCIGCVGCGGNNACCGSADHQWDSCEPGEADVCWATIAAGVDAALYGSSVIRPSRTNRPPGAAGSFPIRHA